MDSSINTLSNPRSVSLEEAASRLFNTPLMIRPMDGRVLAANLRHLRNDGTVAIQMVEPKIEAIYGNSTAQRKPYRIAGDGVAIIEVSGRLVNRYGWAEGCGYTSYEYLRAQLNFALGDNDVKSIVMRFESGGGECAGSFELADLIYQSRKQKRIYGVTDDYAYSAAALLLVQCEKVFVTRSGGVGSVGVIAQLLDVTEFDKKAGFHYVVLFAGEKKAAGNPHLPIDDLTTKDLQVEIDRLYGMFVSAVARGRGMAEAAVRKTEAGLYFGADAVTIGFADQIANFHEVVAMLSQEKSKAGGSPAQMVAGEPSPAMETGGGEDIVAEDPAIPAADPPPVTEVAAAEIAEPPGDSADEEEEKEEEEEEITMPDEKIQAPAPAAAAQAEVSGNEFKTKMDMCALASLPPLATYGEMTVEAVQADLFKRLAEKDNTDPARPSGTPTRPSTISKMEEITAAAEAAAGGDYDKFRKTLAATGRAAYAAYSSENTLRIG